MKKLLLLAILSLSLFGGDLTCSERKAVYDHFATKYHFGGGQKMYFPIGDARHPVIVREHGYYNPASVTIINKTGRTIPMRYGFDIRPNYKIRITDRSVVDYFFLYDCRAGGHKYRIKRVDDYYGVHFIIY